MHNAAALHSPTHTHIHTHRGTKIIDSGELLERAELARSVHDLVGLALEGAPGRGDARLERMLGHCAL
jgi:hypothetical protein